MKHKEGDTLMTKKQKLLLFFTLVLMLVVIIGYRTYRRLPTYTFVLIQQAVEKHDWDDFKKHVNTEQVLSTSYDTIIRHSLATDYVVNESTRGFAMGFGNWVKPRIISSLTREIEQLVKTGKMEDVSKNPVDIRLHNNRVAQMMKEKTGLGKLQIITVDDTSLVGEYAIITVKLEDFASETVHLLKLKMKQLSDGTWQVMDIANLPDFLSSVAKVQKEKLAAANSSTRQLMKTQVGIGKPAVRIHRNGPYMVANFSLPLHFYNGDPIVQVSGRFRLEAPDGTHITIPFDVVPAKGGVGKQVVQYQKELEPFIPEEARWAAFSPGEIQVTAVLSQLLYENGTRLELKQTL